MNLKFVFLLFFVIICLIISEAYTQPVGSKYYHPADERFKLLALRKAELYLQETKTAYQRAKELYDQQLISLQEYENAKLIYNQAQVAYQQALLNIIFDKAHISITKAVKYRSADGKKHVRLTLQHTSSGAYELERLKSLESSEISTGTIAPQVLTNIYVSLKSDHTIIGQPYEAIIPELEYGKTVTLEFELLRDVEELEVSINYADKIDEKKIYLQKDITADIVTVTVSQFSQEADLGEKAVYNLTLERFSEEDKIYKLELLRLPGSILYEFIDTETDARLTQLKFANRMTTKELQLVLYLPDRQDKKVIVDHPIEFYVLVMDNQSLQQLREHQNQKTEFTDKLFTQLKCGNVKLELIPRGVARIELLATNLYHEINPGEQLELAISLCNKGTRKLHNVKLETTLPLGWHVQIDPEVVEILQQDEEREIKLLLQPAEELGVGDYEVKLKASALATNRMVHTDEKIIRIHVKSPVNILGNIILFTVLIGLVIGIVWLGIRLSRR